MKNLNKVLILALGVLAVAPAFPAELIDKELANKAIQAGADPEKVRQRLIEKGVMF